MSASNALSNLQLLSGEDVAILPERLAQRSALQPQQVNVSNDDVLGIDSLPDEMIVEVFKHLSQNQLGQIARVCKKWNALSKSPALWRMVIVEIFRSYDGERDTQLLKSFIDGLPSGVTFIQLDFLARRDFSYVNFEELCAKLHEKCPRVETLNLAHLDLSNSVSEAMNFCTQFLQGLKKLVLHSCRFNDYSRTRELKDNSNIEVLDLNSSLLSNSRKMQFSKFLSLTELRLSTTFIRDDSFVGDASFLNQLHVLDLRWTNVTADTFRAIQRHGQNLKELYLCELPLKDPDFSFSGPAFPHLQTICLCNTRVTDEGLVSLIQSCPSLVSVHVKERLARSFAEHPFVVANRCKSGIVKSMHWCHDHDVDYLHK